MEQESGRPRVSRALRAEPLAPTVLRTVGTWPAPTLGNTKTVSICWSFVPRRSLPGSPLHTSLQRRPAPLPDAMPTERLRRLHAVTDNFFFWQGLRWVPLGAALIIVSISLSPANPLPRELRPWLGVPFLVVAFWLSGSVIGPYYAR